VTFCILISSASFPSTTHINYNKIPSTDELCISLLPRQDERPGNKPNSISDPTHAASSGYGIARADDRNRPIQFGRTDWTLFVRTATQRVQPANSLHIGNLTNCDFATKSVSAGRPHSLTPPLTPQRQQNNQRPVVHACPRQSHLISNRMTSRSPHTADGNVNATNRNDDLSRKEGKTRKPNRHLTVGFSLRIQGPSQRQAPHVYATFRLRHVTEHRTVK
jgi:hypothetical protein